MKIIFESPHFPVLIIKLNKQEQGENVTKKK